MKLLRDDASSCAPTGCQILRLLTDMASIAVKTSARAVFVTIARPKHGNEAQNMLHFPVDWAMIEIVVFMLAASIDVEGVAELLDLAASVVPAQLRTVRGQYVIVKALACGIDRYHALHRGSG